MTTRAATTAAAAAAAIGTGTKGVPWTTSAELADVVTGVPGGQVAHALETSPPGHAVAVLDFSELDVLIASAYQAGTGGWTPQVLHEGNQPSPPLYASGGVDALGRAWIVWAVQAPLADDELRGRRFAGGWSETELVLTTFHAVSVATTVADSGRALLLWIEPDGMSEVLRAAVAEPEGAFAAGPGIYEGFLAEEGSLRVATGPNGHTVAAWLAIPTSITAAAIDW